MYTTTLPVLLAEPRPSSLCHDCQDFNSPHPLYLSQYFAVKHLFNMLETAHSVIGYRNHELMAALRTITSLTSVLELMVVDVFEDVEEAPQLRLLLSNARRGCLGSNSSRYGLCSGRSCQGGRDNKLAPCLVDKSCFVDIRASVLCAGVPLIHLNAFTNTVALDFLPEIATARKILQRLGRKLLVPLIDSSDFTNALTDGSAELFLALRE